MEKFYSIFLTVILIFIFPLFINSAWSKKGEKIPFHLNQNSSAGKKSPTELSQQVQTLLAQETNQNRAKKKLPPLTINETLVKAGLDHSGDMMKRKYLSHRSPEGKFVQHRVGKYAGGEVRTSLGENLHTIQSGDGLRDPMAIASLMMKDWMGSKSHRNNVLSKKFTQVGVGCVSDGNKILCTEVFSGPNL